MPSRRKKERIIEWCPMVALVSTPCAGSLDWRDSLSRAIGNGGRLEGGMGGGGGRRPLRRGGSPARVRHGRCLLQSPPPPLPALRNGHHVVQRGGLLAGVPRCTYIHASEPCCVRSPAFFSFPSSLSCPNARRPSSLPMMVSPPTDTTEAPRRGTPPRNPHPTARHAQLGI